MTIRGWEAICRRVNVNEQIVKRWMKLYNFPQPERVREGRYYIWVWQEPEVDSWVYRNKEFVAHQKRSNR
jgi:hypothetical protein